MRDRERYHNRRQQQVNYSKLANTIFTRLFYLLTLKCVCLLYVTRHAKRGNIQTTVQRNICMCYTVHTSQQLCIASSLINAQCHSQIRLSDLKLHCPHMFEGTSLKTSDICHGPGKRYTSKFSRGSFRIGACCSLNAMFPFICYINQFSCKHMYEYVFKELKILCGCS